MEQTTKNYCEKKKENRGMGTPGTPIYMPAGEAYAHNNLF